MTHKIFCYGTLLSGEANAHVMRGAKLLGEGTVPGTLYGFGFAPGAVHPRRKEHVANGVVHGELYEVDDELLAMLDYLEKEPINYTRTDVLVTLEFYDAPNPNGNRGNRDFVDGEIYYYNHPVDGGELITSGKWRDRTRRGWR